MKKYSIVVPTVLLAVLFFGLFRNYSERFDEINQQYENGSSVNLVKGVSPGSLSGALTLHNYIADKGDADFVSGFISHKLEEGKTLSTLYDLNKRIWQIPVSLIDSLGRDIYRAKAAESKESIGIDANFRNLDTERLPSSAAVNPEHSGIIDVSVTEKIENAGFLSRKTRPCANVVVRLSEQYVDSLDNYKSQRRTVAYLKTDESGKVSFRGLDTGLSYSVLPIREGFEYGMAKGTLGGSLSTCHNGAISCSFEQQEHRIRIFDAATLKQMKEDRTLTVRSPEEFYSVMLKYLVLFFIVWWGIWTLCLVRKKPLDYSVFSILMALTGLCLLTMFSINEPLTDKLLGVDMAQGIIAGVILIAFLLDVNFKKLYQDRLPLGFDVPLECLKWLFKPFRQKVSYLTGILSNSRKNVIVKCLALLGVIMCLPLLLLDLVRLTSLRKPVCSFIDRLPKGSGYLLMALLLTALLFTPLGVEVGGMKVNLNIGILFQPSEIAKYLIIFYMASYFSVNANRIVQFSEKGNVGLSGAKLRMMTSIFIGLGLLSAIYLALGDMGPALVLAFTFIILYSVIKSKVDLEGIAPGNQLKRIFSCDIAVLVYGVLSFVLFLCLGSHFGNMGIFCIAWFVVWILFGLARKQIHETPVLFNFIIAAFIFGGSILGSIPGFESVADRLDSRTEMCTNTWGTLPLDGCIADAGENTQVAEGLWGLASGGFFGQGLGNGSPHFIPAFHTDMILQSVGEQIGFAGLLIILLLLAFLLRKTVVLGYRTSHPFTFYLCLGIAIVTAVQFIIISLGSTGIIPLTGVTVPFFSYGKVSMILNLAAYGIILSIASHTDTESRTMGESAVKLARQNIGKYNYSVSLLSWIYCIFALMICGVFFYYQCIGRDDTLIRPIYVNNSNGIPIVEYNPRIEQMTREMYAGDIFDRNGILLATSDSSKLKEFRDNYSGLGLDNVSSKRQRRYYPFGEHLFFMLGDVNSQLYFSADADSRYPRGYMAESKHITELRGFDNKLRDKKGEPVKVDLHSDEYVPDKYHSDEYSISFNGCQLRDYSALLPYLKNGLYGRKVRRLNEGGNGEIKPQDVQLTIDAVLQTDIQSKTVEYVKKYHSNLNKLRVSVVILDAQNGDLLTSAVYPLPDSDTLRIKNGNYDDLSNTSPSWRAYSDMDLGMIFPSSPGSSAKVVTGLAGYRKDGDDIENCRYFVDEDEKIFRVEPTGWVDMRLAYVKSSNCYFVNLMNDRDLFDDLATVYGTLGITINGNKSYTFNYHNPSTEWLSLVLSARDRSISKYREYKESGKKQKMNNKTGKPDEWSWSWGQNGMEATPIAMARALSVVANDGEMPITRYTFADERKTVRLLASTDILKGHLKATREQHESGRKFSKRTEMGGKTGTPERITEIINKTVGNDGWYVCFIEDASITSKEKGRTVVKNGAVSRVHKAPLAIAVRMERLGVGEMSGRATAFMDEVVMGSLVSNGYIKEYK